jgi:hypothetical protein
MLPTGKPPAKSYLVPILSGVTLLIALLLFVFLDRKTLAQWTLSEGQVRIWDIILKAFAGYMAISGALIAALKYLDDKANATEIARREASKDFFAKRQEVYFRLVQSIAEIINHDPGDPEWNPAKEAFWKIYWGEIGLVSDKYVAEAVETFSDALWNHEKNDEEALSELGKAIVRACRISLGETWNVEQVSIPKSPFISTRDRR